MRNCITIAYLEFLHLRMSPAEFAENADLIIFLTSAASVRSAGILFLD